MTSWEAIRAVDVPAGRSVHYFGGHSDGLAVRVTPSSGAVWVGIFAPGDSARRAASGIYRTPDDRLGAVSRGNGWLVAPDDPARFEQVVLSPVVDVLPAPHRGVLVFADPWELCAYGARGLAWRTGRLAIDGFRALAIEGDAVCGAADFLDREDVSFAVDLATGAVRRTP